MIPTHPLVEQPVLDPEVVDQPESARLLLLAQERCSSSPRGKVTREDLINLAHKTGISLSHNETQALINKLVAVQYLAEPEHWLGHYQIGPRVYKEYEYLKLLAGKLDLKKALMWFGTPQLPERCTAKTIAEERKLAEQAGIEPPGDAMIASAQRKGGKRLEVADRYELRRAIAGLIKEYAPDERELADALLVPRND